MSTLLTIRDNIIKEFDTVFIHENLWKSNDESEAYAPIENMRQFIFEKVKESYFAGQQSVLERARGIEIGYSQDKVFNAGMEMMRQRMIEVLSAPLNDTEI